MSDKEVDRCVHVITAWSETFSGGLGSPEGFLRVSLGLGRRDMRAVPVDDKMTVAIKKVGVIGSGQMGNGIAHVAALAGFDVVLNDVSATG